MPDSIKNTWNALSFQQRIALVGVLVAVFGGILFAASMAGRPTYGVLFSKLETEDAAAVTDKLREMKVPYRLAEGGKTVEVPQDKVYDLRLSLASEGLPRGGTIGFELFDKPSFGATDFTQHLNYQRALQGELVRTIGKLEGVMDARVHLAIPERRLFEQQQEPATASVVLHLRPSYQIPERQVAGIVHLVSSAVEGLKTENVTVHDAQGELLSGDQTSGAGMTTNQLQLQERYERRMERELTRLAEQVLGAGKAAIRVSADLNWDQTETNSETYQAGGKDGKGIPLEESLTTEEYNRDAQLGEGGAAGTASNLDDTDTAPAATGAKKGDYLNSRSTNRYAVNRVTEKRVTAPGKVRRLSVAVLIDGKISSGQQRALKDVFSAAAGLELDAGGRGDRIELLPMEFDRTAEADAAKAASQAAQQQGMQAMVRNGAAVAMVLLMLGGSLLLVKLMRAPRKAAPTAPEPEAPRLDAVIADPLPLEGGPAVAGLRGGPQAAVSLPEGERDYTLPPLEVVRALAAERPEEIARQLEAWIGE